MRPRPRSRTTRPDSPIFIEIHYSCLKKSGLAQQYVYNSLCAKNVYAGNCRLFAGWCRLSAFTLQYSHARWFGHKSLCYSKVDEVSNTSMCFENAALIYATLNIFLFEYMETKQIGSARNHFTVSNLCINEK